MGKRMAAALTVAALVGLAGAALAQERGARLTIEQLRAEFFGVEMAGRYEGGGQAWTECIEPDGDTRYRLQGQPMLRGTLRINDTGEACYAYVTDNYVESCWAVYREGRGYRFQNADAGADFVATTVRRGVRSCDAPAAVS